MIVGSTREYSEYTIGYGKSREGSNRTTTTVTDLLPYSTATVDKDYLLLFVLGVDCVEVHGVGEVSLLVSSSSSYTSQSGEPIHPVVFFQTDGVPSSVPPSLFLCDVTV